ncbi:hypothetical protein F4802DRAFT_73155 [Xylaria palmicola]|nr:hypothetical protein F4802DRAFT_73155 [Xylaria palmicola]
MMPFAKKTAVIMCLALMGTAKPIHPAGALSQRAQAEGSDATILVEPTMYQIYPFNKEYATNLPHVEIQRTGNTSLLENVAVFEGIPANARTCQLGWTQAERDERKNFTVHGNGLLSTQQLSRFPDEGVSWASIAPIVDEAVEEGWPLLHPDTTGWPAISTAESHIAGFVDCAETIYFKIHLDPRNGDGYVLLEQDPKNSLTLTFTLPTD